MEFEQTVKARQSVRHFRDGVAVDADSIKEIIAAAQMAPSWKNSQTTRWHVALTPQARDTVAACLPVRNRQSTAGCAAYLVASFLPGVAGFDDEGRPVNELGDCWGAYDCGLQSMLLMLAASDRGLDTLVLGLRDAAALHRALDIPEGQVVMAVIALGRRASQPVRPPRLPLDEVAKIF